MLNNVLVSKTIIAKRKKKTERGREKGDRWKERGRERERKKVDDKRNKRKSWEGVNSKRSIKKKRNIGREAER